MSDARAARAAVFAVFAAHGFLLATWFARIPAVRGDLGLSEGELGLVLFGGALGTLLVLPVAGAVVGRRGSRSTVQLCLPVMVAMLPLIAVAPGIAALGAVLFAFGAAGAAVDVAMNAHGLAVERLYERPILSTLHAGWSIGALAGAGSAALAAAAGVAPLPHFLAAAVVAGAASLVAAPRLLPAEADRPEGASGFVRPPAAMLPLALVAFAALFAESAAEGWSAVYLSGSLGTGEGVAALAYTAFIVAMAAGRLAGDRLTAALGPVALTRAGALAAAAGLSLALALERTGTAIAGFALMGIGLAAVVPIAFRAAGSFPGVPAGAGIAALTTVGYGAFLIGPPLIGLTAERIGLAGALWVVVGLLGLLLLLAPAARPVR